ncbi:hypothetical protein PaG_05873 [Moesziomyces aphidis]|uniref:ER-bound oxygenase mpaB/mpaB'/Rubber oxygenase catalytic domain-containing protein n=1 Tax=Moesziomyces aphidis TaxID=84754 RepID=W3VE40_MOEAP|nr:hypothetical protein PaG_05873 [Moesziomyces aphidis]
MFGVPVQQLPSAWLAAVTSPTCAWSASIAVLLCLVPPARALTVRILCEVYSAVVHRPFVSAPIAFLFSAKDGPLPKSDSLWSRLQAATTLQWRAKHAGLRHERHIDWTQPDQPQEGDMIEAWDRIAEWDSACFHPHKLEQLRRFGDSLADDALARLDRLPAVEPPSTDTLRRIFDEASKQVPGSDQPTECRTFWQSIDRRPPPGAGALGLDWYRSQYNPEEVQGLPHWPRHPSSNQKEPVASIPVWSPSGSECIDAGNGLEELRAEAEIIRRGQDVFYRYAGPILTVLLHFSLAGGFASPRITEVLKQTAYLVPSSASVPGQDMPKSASASLPTIEDLRRVFKVDKERADRTWDRLLETTQFVLDVMEHADSLHPPSSPAATPARATTSSEDQAASSSSPESGGDGWQSAVRVRLLHANVRRRVLKMAERRKASSSPGGQAIYDVEKNGMPINQEDLLGTLCAFSSAPLAMLQKIGITPTAQEREDYIALWRHVGFYMGIEPALLRRAFKDAHTADRTLWCTILHLFSKVEVLDSQAVGGKGSSGPRMQGPTIPVLIACADRPPFHTPLSAHVAIARRLIGKSLADALALPASSAKREVLTDIAFLGMRVPIAFGSIYPRRSWERRRLQLARPLLRRLIVFSFGDKRTKFEMPLHQGAAAAEAAAAAESRPTEGERVNVQTQSRNHQEVPVDKEANLQLVRQWRRLMREMIAVMAASALLVVAGAAAACYRLFASSQSGK